jgi:hypothetical protein
MNKYYYVETTICDSEGEYDMPSIMEIDSKIDVNKHHAVIEKNYIWEIWDSEAEHREDGWYLSSWNVNNRRTYLTIGKEIPLKEYKVVKKYLSTWEYEGDYERDTYR